MKNLETVKSIYAAFARQDVAAAVEHFADDIEWEYAYPDRGVPWLLPRRGRAASAEFFRALGEHLDITRFEVTRLLADETLVVAVVSIDAKLKKNGKVFSETDEVHLWHFDAKGRVSRFRHAADTFQHVEAWRG